MWMRLMVAGAAAASTAGLMAQGSASSVRLSLSEGTSMAAALSPDGRTIAIDLQGALWTLPSTGGAATRILDDGYDAHLPVWSPDGRRLAFQAYRDSTWNLWTMNADGSGLRQETAGPFDDREPHWSPDGTRLAFSSDRGGSYDVWLLTLKTSEVRQVTSHAANDYMPSWSPDGREIAFASDRRERGVYAVDVQSGAERLVAAETRVIAAPVFSRDGATIAYSAFEGAVSQLMAGGANIADANEDVFPFRSNWTATGDLLYTADGQIKRRPAAGGPARVVPFTAAITLARAPFTPKRRVFSPAGPQPVRGLMHPAVSPDGKQVAFAALGDLWLAATTGGEVTPERLTNDRFVEIDPAWSPDGTRLAFSADRSGSMDLWVRDLRTRTDRKLASNATAAAWSPDASQIVFLNPGAELQVLDVATGQTRRAHDRLNEPGRPSWSPDGRFVVTSALKPYSTRFREGVNQVLRVPVNSEGADRWLPPPVAHKAIGMREQTGPVWSPDGTQMAALIDGHLTTFPVGGDGTPTGPPRRVSEEIANAPSWTADSRFLLYQTVAKFRLVDIITGQTRDIVPRLSWTAPVVRDSRTVHAGRLVDGRSAAPRENVDIVMQGNRITRVEPHRSDLHVGTVVDASNATVLPGLIESHAHLSKGTGEALGRIWLSYGITTVRNPAANAFEGAEDREAYDSGARIGPRVLTTGEPFDGTRIYYPGGAALDGGTEVSERLRVAEAMGFDLIKTYVRLPDLLQQRVIAEAHRMGMPVTSHEIYPAAAYGADGVEHIRGTSRRGFSPKMSELRRSYKDVIELLAASKMTLTPTIGIQGGYQTLLLHDPSWLDDVRLQRLFPPSATEAVRVMVANPRGVGDLATRDALVAPQERMTAELVKRGGRVIAGTDSPINPYGLSLLMELEHFVRGGMSPADAIRTATAVPAEAMGLGADLGTIEVGKLADLVIVDGNPLVRISDVRKTRTVIKDGVVYELESLLRAPATASK
jgi:Tol biopolymer transport system component/imidazolonepropionase-like amidohydrolase